MINYEKPGRAKEKKMGAMFQCRGCGKVMDAREQRFPMRKDEFYCDVCYKKFGKAEEIYKERVAKLDEQRAKIRTQVNLEVYGKWDGEKIVPWKAGDAVVVPEVKTPKGGDKVNELRNGTKEDK